MTTNFCWESIHCEWSGGPFHRPPDQLGPGHIREYTAHLFRNKKLSDNSVNQTVGALRFFFVKMLKRPWGAEETPYPKKRMRLPVILNRDEVALIESAPSPSNSNQTWAMSK